MVLNMLIGVLCAVVTAVAATEKEKNLVGYVKARLMTVMEELDEDKNGTICKAEFVQLINIPDAVQALQDLGVDVQNLVSLADHLFSVEDSEELVHVHKQPENASDEEDAAVTNSTVVAAAPFESSVSTSSGFAGTGQVQPVKRTLSVGGTVEAEDGDEGPSMSFADFLEMVIRLRAENLPSVADIVDLRKLLQKNQKAILTRAGNIEKHQHELQKGINTICEQLDGALTLCMDLQDSKDQHRWTSTQWNEKPRSERLSSQPGHSGTSAHEL